MRSADQDQESGLRLADLEREVIETRNQMIKTANVVSNLTADVRELGRLNRRLERGRRLNSLAVYGVLQLAVAAGLYFTFQARVERVAFEKNVLLRQNASVQNKLKEIEEQRQARLRTEAKAYAFYRLMQGREIHQAIKRYPEVARLPLSKVEMAVFRDWVARNRSRLAYTAYSNGMRLVGEKSWRRAAAELRTSLSLVPDPPHAGPLHYYLGVSLMKVGSYVEAAEALRKAIARNAEKQVSREVRYYLATVYDQLGRRSQAKAAYREYIKRHPSTSYARAGRRRIKQLE